MNKMKKGNTNSNSSLKIVMRKLNFLFSLFLIATFIPSTILGGPIEDLKPGEWYEVPNSRMIDVAPTEGFGNGNPSNVIKAWNGGAYDTTRDRLIVWGGGHGDYGGNEIYTFDINTLSWSRVWGPSPNIPSGWGIVCLETYDDGNPRSRHTYDGLEYIPSIDRFYTEGGSLYCGPGARSKATWTFDFNNLVWERKSDIPSTILGSTTSYDPVTGHVFYRGQDTFNEYNPVNDTYITRASLQHLSYAFEMKGAVDPVNRLFVEVGNGYIRAVNLDTWEVFTPSTTGGGAIINATGPGFVYDPVLKKFVAWASGTSVYSLDVSTWTWVEHPSAISNNTTPNAPTPRGTFGRFRYIPSRNAYIVVNDVYANVYIYKLSSGGSKPPPDTTPPLVSIAGPAPGTTVSGTMTISANASDNVAVAGVQFKLDGTNLGVEDTTSPYAITWDTTTVTDGSHTLTAVTRDDTGNTATADNVIITVSNGGGPSPDNTLPTISITAPTQGATVSSTKTVSASASDNVGIVGVQFKLDGANLGVEDTTSPYAITWDTTTVADGSHTLTAIARDAAGNTATASGATITVSNTTTPPPVGQIDIPLRTWVKWSDTPGYGIGPSCGEYGCKHVRLTYNPVDGRIYFMGGDYAGPIGIGSKRNELYSYSIANDDWRQEYPYCGIAGEVQPRHPDQVGFVYDTNRNIFWLTPGHMGADAGHCSSTLLAKMMTFDPATQKWSDPQVDTGVGGSKAKFAQYDPVTDTIIKFVDSTQIHIYDIKTDTWTELSFSEDINGVPISSQVTWGASYTALDLENRYIYFIIAQESRLYRYYMDSRQVEYLIDTPEPITGTWGGSDLQRPIWDSVNKLLLWPQVFGNDGWGTKFNVYHPDTNTWEANLPLNQPAEDIVAGIEVGGNMAVFDPIQNVLLLMGGSDPNKVNPHIFLYRYGNGSGTPPPSDTTPPSVSIKEPAPGTTVSGTFTVSADASDNVAVTGVQFKLDGTNLGAEDTAFPYSISWNTTAVANGSHILTAVARDAAGNISTAENVIVTVSNSQSNGTVYNANPSNYLNTVSLLQPGDTLLLEAGNYNNLLRATNLNGEPGNPIIIKGADNGPKPVFLGRLNTNVVEISNSSYLELRNFEINAQYMSSPIVSKTVTHHITIENLYIHSFSDSQQTVGISANHNVSWNWVIRNNIITDGGTGIYLGDSDGDSQFINGIIENNLIYDTIGYNMEIKHQIPRPTNIPGMPTGKSITIIRNNVFSKGNNASSGIMARPNVLVGHFPTSGTGINDEYHFYGNFFYQNPYEALFQGEGNVALYNNLFVNTMDSGYTAVSIQPHHDVPKKIRVFNNTIVSKDRGISVSGGDPSYEQKVIGNTVFSSIPISAADQIDNIVGSYLNAANYLVNPGGTIGVDLDLYPKAGMLSGSPIITSSTNTFTDWNKDFNGNLHDGTFRGAYDGEGQNPGWKLKLERKPLVLDNADTNTPTISSVSTSGDSTIVTIVFSESVEQASAENSSNYQIDNAIIVSSASLDSDLKTVTLTTSPHSEGISYILTVNNIKDRASTPNVIASNTAKTYVFAAQLVISNVTVASGKAYEVVQDGLQVGAIAYIDRTYTYSSVPALVQKATYIKTANNDKGSTGDSFLTFNVNRAVTVYVAHDNRTTLKSSWLSSFSDTGEDIVTTDTNMSIFVKEYPAGTIALGGNEGGGNSMYTVIIMGQGTNPSAPPAAPTGLRFKQ